MPHLRFSIFIFSSEAARLMETKLHVEPLLDGGMEVCSWGLGHMISMVIMCPYMAKTFENLLLWNQMADDLETWYAPVGTWALPNLLKW